MDSTVRSMAEVLVSYSVGVKPGDWVLIQSGMQGERLVTECARAVLKAGGHPTPVFQSEDFLETLLKCGNEDQLTFIAPSTRAMYDLMDVSISISAPVNSRALAGVEAERMVAMRRAQGELLRTRLRRSAAGEARWTVTAFPTHAGAQDAGMSLAEYEAFIFRACLLDRPDPVAAWRALAAEQQRLVDRLDAASELHIVGEGTDLTVGVSGRKWVNSDGHRNFPSGEVFTSPVEESAEGTICFNFPASYGGKDVPDVCLKFQAGTVVDASARQNEEFLLQMLDMDEGSRRLGEVAFGSNYGITAFTKNVLFDEKIGGTMHLALGRSYPETGGVNESSIHWDMVLDLRRSGRVTVDGHPFSLDGRFQV